MTTDRLFRAAVAAIDRGDVEALRRLLAERPRLATARLDRPGAWLKDQVGDALQGFFRAPYLLWFVAEDPARLDHMPPAIVASAETIIAAAKAAPASGLQEQLDYAVRLVCWSISARRAGVQLALLETLLGHGAGLDGRALYDGRYGTHMEAAIYNGSDAAARFLLARGARLTLSAALCLSLWPECETLLGAAAPDEKDDAFVLAALRGKTEALRFMLAKGASPDTVSRRNQSHGTALHHAVWSGELAAVKLLVEAGGDLTRRDTLHHATPGDWAVYGAGQAGDAAAGARYRAIAAYLKDRDPKTPTP